MSKEDIEHEDQESPFATAGVVLPVIVAAGKLVVDKLTGNSTDVPQLLANLAAVEGLVTIPLGIVSDVARETIQTARAQRQKP